MSPRTAVVVLTIALCVVALAATAVGLVDLIVRASLLAPAAIGVGLALAIGGYYVCERWLP